MIFIVYSGLSDKTIAQSLGATDYSYYFVQKTYLPVLGRIGSVKEVDHLEQVDAIYAEAQSAGEACFFLSFIPPHKTNVSLACPTVPVFAWEYSSIPSEAWGGDERNDWRTVLRHTGQAITHSSFAVDAVHKAMGNGYKVSSIPAPVWDTYQFLASKIDQDGSPIEFYGQLLDSSQFRFDALTPENRQNVLSELLAPALLQRQHSLLLADQVIYTAVTNPLDGRKNWEDTLSAFCYAFRASHDTTLIIKLTHCDVKTCFEMIAWELYKLQPFSCQVYVLGGFIDEVNYGHLVMQTNYVVNSSHGEGQCLPLMEFMSAAVPAVAPNHSAMADYINDKNAFVVDSESEWMHWPHDPRLKLTCLQARINWESLCMALTDSYRIFKEDPARYKEMGRHAVSATRSFCSQTVAEERLRAFFYID